MRAADEVEVVLAEELLNDVRAECEGDTTVGLTPANEALVGIGPKKVADETGVGDVAGTHDLLDLVHDGEFGREAAVAAEDLLVDDAGDGQAVEGVGEGLPELDVVAALALVEEAVDAVDGGALVVSAENEEVLGELDLEGEDEADALEALLAAVDVVAEEEVVGGRREAAVLEEAEQIVVLAVDVAADLDGRLELEQR